MDLENGRRIPIIPKDELPAGFFLPPIMCEGIAEALQLSGEDVVPWSRLPYWLMPCDQGIVHVYWTRWTADTAVLVVRLIRPDNTVVAEEAIEATTTRELQVLVGRNRANVEEFVRQHRWTEKPKKRQQRKK